MKHAIRTGGANFTARRMLKEYVERFYVPAARAGSESAADSVAAAGTEAATGEAQPTEAVTP
jgi:starch phosphorylase